MDAEEIKRILGLKPLPEEGGFYAETYRSEEVIAGAGLPRRYGGQRCFGTAIYYLLTNETFSGMHKVASDEIYHFYLGDPVESLLLHEDGSGEVITLGSDLAAGMKVQCVFPRSAWQGSRVKPGGKFALLGATVAPGFEFADFELGHTETLLARYPDFADLIRKLTR